MGRYKSLGSLNRSFRVYLSHVARALPCPLHAPWGVAAAWWLWLEVLLSLLGALWGIYIWMARISDGCDILAYGYGRK